MLKFKGEIQRIVYDMLIKDGEIVNLGQTYRSFSNSPRRVSNASINSFLNKVEEEHDITLIKGPRGGLDTATLVLR